MDIPNPNCMGMGLIKNVLNTPKKTNESPSISILMEFPNESIMVTRPYSVARSTMVLTTSVATILRSLSEDNMWSIFPISTSLIFIPLASASKTIPTSTP